MLFENIWEGSMYIVKQVKKLMQECKAKEIKLVFYDYNIKDDEISELMLMGCKVTANSGTVRVTR